MLDFNPSVLSGSLALVGVGGALRLWCLPESRGSRWSRESRDSRGSPPLGRRSESDGMMKRFNKSFDPSDQC